MTMTSKTNITRYSFDTACHNLTRFVFDKAAQVTRVVGISYRESSQCPESGKAIAAEFERCRRACEPFPVYDGGCERTIYDIPAANYAFRFWHDSIHWTHGYGVGLADELRIADVHHAHAVRAFGVDSLEALIQRVDVAEQARFYSVTGEFVQDQKAFVWACVTRDIDALNIISPDYAINYALRVFEAERDAAESPAVPFVCGLPACAFCAAE
jgi:hypothetical protein